MAVELSDKQFLKISQIIYELCGINLKEGKQALVRSRLMKRLRVLKMGSFKEYIKFIESDNGRQEIGFMVDVMTTNKTSFFREPAHFRYLEENVLPNLNKKRIRFWTAACSSGEEPFSLAMVVRENIQNINSRDIRILATDISRRMLERARNAVYEEEKVFSISPPLIKKYFVKIGKESPSVYQLKDSVKSLVHLAWLNLMDKWPMKGPFDLIFCRNVMIYFDRTTQQNLINRFWDYLEPGGYLFVGHSEGLSSISHKFEYVRPAIYRK
ncbi:MAG: protein-glutamate O-methyltransferase [Deltaproteobacteria bacterium]|nr:protein-glutamate O-methyltransferase [Deltaproteobacteria bacterium]